MKETYVDIRLKVKGNIEKPCVHNLENALALGHCIVSTIKEEYDKDLVDVDVVRVGMEDTLKFEIPENFLDSE